MHHRSQLRGDRQTQTGAAESRVVELSACSNASEDVRRACLRECRCRCRRRQTKCVAIGSRRAGSQVTADDTTSPCSVNLMALPTRLTTITCRSRPGSPTALGHVGIDVDRPAPTPCLWARSASDFIVSPRLSSADSKSEYGSSSSFPGLDLREVEDVVDQRQQRLGRGLDHLRGIRAACEESVGVEHQFGHADDGVHRRADLVAHVGQEVPHLLSHTPHNHQ